MTALHLVAISTARWTDIPTPAGPDMQVRLISNEMTLDSEAGEVTTRIDWRVKPSLDWLDERGITREESDRDVHSSLTRTLPRRDGAASS
jgi:hypothetical protein